MRSILFSVALLSVIAAGEAEADTPKLTWDSSGYFRTRAVALTNLAPVDSCLASPLCCPAVPHTTSPRFVAQAT